MLSELLGLFKAGIDLSTPPSNPISWQQAFPEEHTSRVVDYLVNSWHSLMADYHEGFDRNDREDKLTVLFAQFLEERSVSLGKLTGKWFYEVPTVSISFKKPTKPYVSKAIRKDIVYFSDADPSKRLHLIFEFKKVSNTAASAKHYCDERGVRRFVDGEYAKSEPLAFMVGMLLDDEVKCITRIHKKLLKDKSLLLMKCFPSGDYINDPSTNFSTAKFDTHHDRPIALKTAHNEIMLSHIFVNLP